MMVPTPPNLPQPAPGGSRGPRELPEDASELDILLENCRRAVELQARCAEMLTTLLSQASLQVHSRRVLSAPSSESRFEETRRQIEREREALREEVEALRQVREQIFALATTPQGRPPPAAEREPPPHTPAEPPNGRGQTNGHAASTPTPVQATAEPPRAVSPAALEPLPPPPDWSFGNRAAAPRPRPRWEAPYQPIPVNRAPAPPAAPVAAPEPARPVVQAAPVPTIDLPPAAAAATAAPAPAAPAYPGPDAAPAAPRLPAAKEAPAVTAAPAWSTAGLEAYLPAQEAPWHTQTAADEPGRAASVVAPAPATARAAPPGTEQPPAHAPERMVISVQPEAAPADGEPTRPTAAAPDEPLAADAPARRRTTPNRVARVLGTLASVGLGLLLLVLAALLTPLPELAGYQLFAIQGGSMEPTIPLGGVIGVRPTPANQLRPGDVITFMDQNRPNVRVTHRIVDMETRDGRTVAVTKGDANNVTDSWNVPVDQAIGRVEWYLPYLGYVMVWLGTPIARIAALVLAAVLFLAPSLFKRFGGASKKSVASEDTPSFDLLASDIDALLSAPGPAGDKQK